VITYFLILIHSFVYVALCLDEVPKLEQGAHDDDLATSMRVWATLT
jgi:hypothetical protein